MYTRPAALRLPGGQKGMQGADANYVRRMVDFIWGPLVEAIGKVLYSYQISKAASHAFAHKSMAIIGMLTVLVGIWELNPLTDKEA